MLIPIRDSAPAPRLPVVTFGMIVICSLVFFFELSRGPGLADFIGRAAFIPARLFDSVPAAQMPVPDYGLLGNVLSMIASVFLHAGWLHLIGNMWFLYIFGDNIEGVMGGPLYVLFYFAGGLASLLTHAVFHPASVFPIVGASGAVAAVLGAYFCWYPRSRVHTLVFLGVFITMTEIPAIVFLGFWFVLQIVLGALTTASGSHVVEVAWFAHVGGFVFGFLFALLMRQSGKIDEPLLIGMAGRKVERRSGQQ